MPHEVISSQCTSSSLSVIHGKTTDSEAKVYPRDILYQYSGKYGLDLISREFAGKMDELDPLRDLQTQFSLPLKKDLPNSKYMCQLAVIMASKNAEKFTLIFNCGRLLSVVSI